MIERRDSSSPTAPQATNSPGGRRPREGEGWLAALAAPLFIVLADLCCGGPLLAAALVATGAGAWLAAHGFLLGAMGLLVIATLLVWRWRLRASRES